MAESTRRGAGPLGTVTHARVRASQGDLEGARRILEDILARTPQEARARALLSDLAGARGRPRPEEPDAESIEPPVAGDLESLTARWKRERSGARGAAARRRLESFLSTIRRARGDEHPR